MPGRCLLMSWDNALAKMNEVPVEPVKKTKNYSSCGKSNVNSIS